MLRKFLPRSSSTVVVRQQKVLLVSSSSSSSMMTMMIKPSMVLLSGGKKSGSGVGFKEEDVPSDMLKNPVWDRDDVDGLYDGELGGDETMLMSESEWEFFESLQLLSEEELDLLEKDTKAAKKGNNKK